MGVGCGYSVTPMTTNVFEGFEKWLEVEFFLHLQSLMIQNAGAWGRSLELIWMKCWMRHNVQLCLSSLMSILIHMSYMNRFCLFTRTSLFWRLVALQRCFFPFLWFWKMQENCLSLSKMLNTLEGHSSSLDSSHFLIAASTRKYLIWINTLEILVPEARRMWCEILGRDIISMSTLPLLSWEEEGEENDCLHLTEKEKKILKCEM